MKVELLVSRSGPAGSQSRGEVVEVSKDEAERMIAAGQAVPVRRAGKAETTAATPAGSETTAR